MMLAFAGLGSAMWWHRRSAKNSAPAREGLVAPRACGSSYLLRSLASLNLTDDVAAPVESSIAYPIRAHKIALPSSPRLNIRSARFAASSSALAPCFRISMLAAGQISFFRDHRT
jgi:hypothetical protein